MSLNHEPRTSVNSGFPVPNPDSEVMSAAIFFMSDCNCLAGSYIHFFSFPPSTPPSCGRGLTLFLAYMAMVECFLVPFVDLIRAGWSGLILFDWAPCLKGILEGVFLCVLSGALWIFRKQLLFASKNNRAKETLYDDIVSRSFIWSNF
ncbi:hypothetical protein Tco_0361191 [Tanacetum coccineum]